MAHPRVGNYTANQRVNLDERVKWARRRVEDAARLLTAHPNDPCYQAAYDARLAELQQLQWIARL